MKKEIFKELVYKFLMHSFEKTKEHFAQNDIAYTETKFENTINRLTAVANPRQIERVTRGSEFDFVFIYNVDEESQVENDFENIEKQFTY